MKGRFFDFFIVIASVVSCTSNDEVYEELNPEVSLKYPKYFPSLNKAFYQNKPTKFGIILGEKLFNDKRLSVDNSTSCTSCHIPSNAFSDKNKQSIGVFGRKGLRNVPPLQNLAFKKHYTWDGNHISLKGQVLVPIITPEEMGTDILQVIGKIKDDESYKELFSKVFGDEKITGNRIYKSIEQYEYTLISANSKFDKVKRNESRFSDKESIGYDIFKNKCTSCHATDLFTDGSFRNIGFPLNESSEEAGRARVTGRKTDYMAFKVPSLRNIEYTAPYGSSGQFPTIKTVLDYFDDGVVISDNLDPILKNNGGKISLNNHEKECLIAFLKTLSDPDFLSQKNTSQK